MSIRSRFGAAIACAALAGLATSAHTSQITPAAVDRVDFRFQIRPLLSDRCFRCHGPDASKRKAKLRLDTREGAFKEIEDGWAIVKPGDPGKSELIRRINSDYEDDVMPPPESHLTLSEAEKALLKRWIAEGADYKPHWSLIPVHAVEIPAVRTNANPIDEFVRERLERERLRPERGAESPSERERGWGPASIEKGLRPAPPAPPEILLRRLALNLTGLPPTPAEIDAFLADRSPGAYARAADRYLRLTGVRRADGDGLAGSCALCRHVRLSERLRARHVTVPRLGDPRVQSESGVRPVPHLAARGRSPAECDARRANRDRLQPAAPADERGWQHRGGVSNRVRPRPGQHLWHVDARADARMLPLSRPQVRSDHAARLLLALCFLQQHRRIRPVLALHQRDTVAVAAPLAGRGPEAARADDSTHRRDRNQADGHLSRCGSGLCRLARDPLDRLWAGPFDGLRTSGAGESTHADRASRVRCARGRSDAGQRAEVPGAGAGRACAGSRRRGGRRYERRAQVHRRQYP